MYNSDVKSALHGTATGLYEICMIGKRTMRGFDKSCLTLVEPLTPRRSNSSQAPPFCPAIFTGSKIHITHGHE